MPAAYGAYRHAARDMGNSLRATAAATGTIATPPAFVTASGFSIAMWVKGYDFSALQSILTEAATTGAPQFRVATARRLELLPRTSGSSLLSAACLRVGEWSHCVATWDAAATRATLYCDGEIVAQSVGTIGGVAFAQPAAALGVTALAGTRMDRLAMWGRELTQAEVRAECYQSAGPTAVAQYLCNEGTGSSAADARGGAAMTLGNFSYSDDTPVYPARIGQDWGSIFQGSAGYLALSSVAGDNMGVAMAGVGNFQLSMWIKLTAATSLIDLFRVTSNGVTSCRVQLDGGTAMTVNHRSTIDATGTLRSANATAPLALGQWVHYSVQINIADGAAGTIKLYRNGILITNTAADFTGQTSIAWTTVTTNCPSWLGAGNAAANPMPGWLGPCRIDPAMTAAQLRTLVFTGVAPSTPYLLWQQTLGAGTTTPNTGSKTGMAGTLSGGAAWSLDAPW